MKFFRIALVALASVLVVAVLASCGGGGSGGPQPAAASGKTYAVTATEFKFDPNQYDGKVGEKLTFKVTNQGTIAHTFVVRNADGSQVLAKTTIQPGQTTTLDYTPSAAGQYLIDCDVAGHKAAGMVGALTVN